MSEKDTQIMETLGRVVSSLTETEKDRFLAFGKGMAIMAEYKEPKEEHKQA